MRLLQKRRNDWAHYPAVNHPDESCLGDKSEAANSTDYQSPLHHADVAAVDRGRRRRAYRLRRFPLALLSRSLASSNGRLGALADPCSVARMSAGYDDTPSPPSDVDDAAEIPPFAEVGI